MNNNILITKADLYGIIHSWLNDTKGKKMYLYYAYPVLSHDLAFRASSEGVEKQLTFKTDDGKTMKQLGLEVIRTVKNLDGTTEDYDGIRILKMLQNIVYDASEVSGCNSCELMELEAYKVMSMLLYGKLDKLYRG